MGTNSSKTANDAKTLPNPKTPEKNKELKLAFDLKETPIANQGKVVEMKSPTIHETPLTKIIANHLNGLQANGVQMEIKTPSYLLRRKILRDLGYAYSINEASASETDPRSPSQLIPRTPLALIDEQNQSMASVSSFQYSGVVEEDSCRNFNEKLANITLDDCDEVKESENGNNGDVDRQEITKTPDERLRDEKTPELTCSPDIDPFKMKAGNGTKGKQVVETPVAAAGSMADEKTKKNAKSPTTSPKKAVKRMYNLYTTPASKFGNRSERSASINNRTPLSVLNRRAKSTEHTPQRAKSGRMDSDENRSSQRSKSASKIPVSLRK